MVKKHKITVGSTGAKDETWILDHLPKNIWKQIIGFHSEVSISHSFISVTNRGQVLPPLHSSPGFQENEIIPLTAVWILLLLTNFFACDKQQIPRHGQVTWALTHCIFLPRGVSSIAATVYYITPVALCSQFLPVKKSVFSHFGFQIIRMTDVDSRIDKSQ